MSRRRVGAIFRKELREYRHNGAIVATMAVLPVIFVISPLIQIFNLTAASAHTLAHKDPLLYMLGIPALVPAALAAYSIVGERAQGTLEPVLTTPIRREELLLAKALAVFVPALVISYAVFALSVVAIALFARLGGRERGAARPAATRPGDIHAADRGLVDLGRDRDLSAHERHPRLPAAERPRQPAAGRDHVADRLRRDPYVAEADARPRDRVAGPRPGRLAIRLRVVRPRAADHRNSIVISRQGWGTSAPSLAGPGLAGVSACRG